MNKDQVKMSYEDLEKIAISLQEKTREQESIIRQLNDITFYKRLDYLFKMIEFQGSFTYNELFKAKEELVSLMFGTDTNMESSESGPVEGEDQSCCPDSEECCSPDTECCCQPEDMSCPSEFIGDSPNA